MSATVLKSGGGRPPAPCGSAIAGRDASRALRHPSDLGCKSRFADRCDRQLARSQNSP